MIHHLPNGKVMIIYLKVRIIKKILLYKFSYFSEPYTRDKNKKVELDLSNYATKFDLKNATGLDTSKLAKKANLASLKLEVGK